MTDRPRRRRRTPEELALARAAKLAGAVPQPPFQAAVPESPMSPLALQASAEMRDRSIIEGAFGAPDPALDILSLDDAALYSEHEALTAAVIEEERELGQDSYWYFLTNHLFPSTWERYRWQARGGCHGSSLKIGE